MLSPRERTKVKTSVLGPEYNLSFSFIDSAESHRLNQNYRGKDKPTNVLSFPLGPNEGEILIDKKLVIEEARLTERDPDEYALFLFIHGLLHLKGFDHGSKMENEEQRLLKLFAHHAQNHSSRSRHRKLRH